MRLPLALLAAGLSGALMSFANPPVQAEPLAFIALVPLLWAIRHARPRRGFLLGFAFGAVYFLATLYWILLFGTLAWSVLSLASAAFMGVAGAIIPLVWREERPVLSVVGIAALWTFTEYVRMLWPLGRVHLGRARLHAARQRVPHAARLGDGRLGDVVRRRAGERARPAGDRRDHGPASCAPGHIRAGRNPGRC